MIALDLKVTASEPSSISCSPGKYSGIYYSYEIIISTYLTQHHGDVIPKSFNSANDRELFKTVSCSEYVAVRYEASPASTTPFGLRGSQKQQSCPGELVHSGLLASNSDSLIMKKLVQDTITNGQALVQKQYEYKMK